MSLLRPPFPENLFEAYVDGTVPSNSALQVRPRTPKSRPVRRPSPRRGSPSPNKVHSSRRKPLQLCAVIQLPQPDASVALLKNSALPKGTLHFHPPGASECGVSPPSRFFSIKECLHLLSQVVALYIGGCILSIFLEDVKRRIATQTLEGIMDAALCRNHYESNLCGTEKSAPMLYQQCQRWNLCMIADPTFVDQSKILMLYIAELLGDFFEGFLGTLSPKAFIFLCAMLIIISNYMRRPRS